MIETIKFEDVEKNLPSGVPANIRALDSSGNSISSSLKNVREAIEIYIYGLSLKQDEEKDLGNLGYGMYLITAVEIGVSAIFIFGSYETCFVSDANKNVFCDYADGTKTIVFGRKTLNGNIFIKSRRAALTNIRIKKISV